MPLPASGPISFNNINVELGVAGTTQASLGQTTYRNLAGVASGQISMSNFYGKANQFAFTISTNQTNANLRTLAVNAGWNQASKVVATINSGVVLSSSSTGTPALTINGSFPGGVDLVNNGLIVGRGGTGGAGATRGSGRTSGSPGAAGGTGLSVSVAVAITNNNIISGGGGGGGGGAGGANNYCGCFFSEAPGGGGGGGTGLGSGGAGGPGGGGASAGSNGNSGTASSGGSGGGGGTYYSAFSGGTGGTGGSYATAGNSGGGAFNNGGGGGGGGAGGPAISGNSNITWVATGSRFGSIS